LAARFAKLLDMLEVFTREVRVERRVLTLEDCLRSFTTPEKLEDNNQMFCPSCRMLVSGRKKTDIWTLPNVLVVQLKRFIVDAAATAGSAAQTRKLDNPVDVPEEIDLADFVRGPARSKGNRFRLYAICDHLGATVHSGHYVAQLCIDEQGRQVWYEFNDSNVGQKPADRLGSEKAYVLFYQRI
jgi:ubiquitin carboxyl-terminal hydrolase 4/11/15